VNGKRMSTPATFVRCAIYTRKSTEEGLQQQFNSLDAQREAAEAFVRSQIGEGWTCLPDRYDDGGFTGANTDRPALKRLLADIEDGRIDCVVVYKVDRLSRSLLDFSRLMENFEKKHVSFVSVTQHFNSATSMGRLTLNILLSFAQFERETISERTKDKMSASRRRGQYVGGQPILGYDVDRLAKRLIVNEDEAARVRAIFGLYAESEALLPVVKELVRRGWTNKRWSTKTGDERGGKPFTKTSLHKLLTSVCYIGRVRFEEQIYAGQQPAIVELAVWQRVQTILERNSRTGGGQVRNQFGALLKGLLHCTPCRCAMVPTHTTRNDSRRYRYYVCSGAQKRGWHTCPSKSIPAGEIERYVINQIRDIGKDPALVRETLAQAVIRIDEERSALEAERRSLERDARRWNDEIRASLDGVTNGQIAPSLPRLADLQERFRLAEQRGSEIQSRLEVLERERITEDEVATALATFDPTWNALTPREQARIIQLLIERIDFDGGCSTIRITFHPSGLKALAAEQSTSAREKRA
jgi:site-specific DNA recombinase